MPAFNQWTGIGNITRDVQIKNLPSGAAVAEFGMAVNRKYRTAAGEDREDVLFIDCAMFGKRAEVLAQYVQKGNPLFVVGHLKLDQWTDKEGGKRSKISVVVDDFQFLGGRNDGGGHGESDDRAAGTHRPSSRPGRAEQQARQQQPEPPFGDEKQFAEADIPF